MKLIELTETEVFYVDSNHKDLQHIGGAWLRADFEAEFGVSIPANLFNLNYEPERNLYVYSIDNVDNCFSIKNITDYPFMETLANLMDEIEISAIATEYPDHNYDGIKDEWAIPDWRQAEITENMRIEKAIRAEMRKTAIITLKASGDIPADYKDIII